MEIKNQQIKQWVFQIKTYKKCLFNLEESVTLINYINEFEKDLKIKCKIEGDKISIVNDTDDYSNIDIFSKLANVFNPYI